MPYVAKVKKTSKYHIFFIFENYLDFWYNIKQQNIRAVLFMDTKLSLQEILGDLRHPLKLEDIANATGISVATLSRFEKDNRQDIPYQSLLKLADHYGVSMDYLCGFTTNVEYRHTLLEELCITDDVVALLKSKKINNRFLCELLTHDDFAKLLVAIEVYLDKALSEGSKQANMIFDFLHKNIRNSIDLKQGKDVLDFLKEVTIAEDEYLRFRISERFNLLLQNLLAEHKSRFKPNKSEVEQMKALQSDLNIFLESKESASRKKFHLLTKQIGLNTNHLTDEECQVLMKALEKSDLVKKSKGKGGKRK